MPHIEINGLDASAEEIHRVATRNHGHFTSMQVRGGAVRGLELHLRRLETASRELFGAVESDGDRVRALIRHALRDVRDASVRVSVVSRAGAPASADVMVAVSDPVSDVPKPALRVRTVTYERELPHLKHLATLGLIHHRLLAQRAGFDDVLFLGRDGYVREGSIWNVAFWDGERVLWPDAEVLPGITMLLLRSALDKIGVPWSTRRLTADALPSLRAAAATYSHCPAQPLASIDHTAFTGDDGELAAALNTAWAEVPWDFVGAVSG
ncbi:aminotransferase class IV [Streptomyces sp. DW26H14]|uniref:aminotransferase class IV n=1 Tax=Streptomyces sp. DW26H14 TaxID=3435395 RepID=UPI00403D76CD